MVVAGADFDDHPLIPTPSESVEPEDDDMQASSQATPAPESGTPFRQAPLPSGLDFGSLCFFKIRNHPNWPGRISGAGIASDRTMKALRGEGIAIFSFGNHDYEVVPPDQIVPFREFLNQKPKRSQGKALRSAIKEAMRVESGEIVIDEATLEIDERAPDRGRGKRPRLSSTVNGSDSTAEQRKQFRRKILAQLGLFPPEVLLADYGLA